MLAYLIIISIALAGMMHAHWWAAIVGGCVLSLLTIVERRPIVLPSSAGEHALAAYAFANGSIAAGAAFVLGQVWGV